MGRGCACPPWGCAKSRSARSSTMAPWSTRSGRSAQRSRARSTARTATPGPRPWAICSPRYTSTSFERTLNASVKRQRPGRSPRSFERSAVVQPRLAGALSLLELLGLGRLLPREADVIQAVQEAVLSELGDLKVELSTAFQCHLLRGQVHRDLAADLGLIHHLVHFLGLQDHRQQAVLEAVVVEDVGERGGDDAANAEVVQRPGRVLARGAAAEILQRHDQLGLAPGLLVQNEVGV